MGLDVQEISYRLKEKISIVDKEVDKIKYAKFESLKRRGSHDAMANILFDYDKTMKEVLKGYHDTEKPSDKTSFLNVALINSWREQ